MPSSAYPAYNLYEGTQCKETKTKPTFTASSYSMLSPKRKMHFSGFCCKDEAKNFFVVISVGGKKTPVSLLLSGKIMKPVLRPPSCVISFAASLNAKKASASCPDIKKCFGSVYGSMDERLASLSCL